MKRISPSPAEKARGTAIGRRDLLAGLAAGGLALALSSPRPALAAQEPLRFAHVYGETVLPRPATRVVSIGYTTQDPLLALGVPPLAVRHWFGDQPNGVWPWARPYLQGAEPVELTGEVSMERVAALGPDLIVAIGSGISKAEYDILSQIAPVLMQGAEDAAYGMPWDRMTRTIGRALGKAGEAERLVAGVERAYAEARARHPGWEDATGVAAYHWGGETGVFIDADTRAGVLRMLGFQPTSGVAALDSTSGFYAPVSPEDLSPLDADVLVWISNYEAVPDLANLPMRRTLRAHREGREVLAGELVAAAMSFGSVLSLPFVLEKLEPEIAAAADGRPETPVPSAVAAGLAP